MRIGRFFFGVGPVVALVLVASSATAQAINHIEARATPTHYSGPGPGTVRFNGRIVVNYRTMVSYRWERSDGGTGPVQSVSVGAGGAAVSTTWRLGSPGKVIHGSERLRVLSPGDAYSGEVTFTMACGGRGGGAYHPVKLPGD